MESQLIAAVAALWLALSGLATGIIKYLRDELTRREKRADEQIAAADAELRAMAAAALVASRAVAEANERQANAQTQTIITLSAALNTPRAPAAREDMRP